MPDRPLRVCMIAPLPPPYGGISHWTAMMFRYAAQKPEVELQSVNTAPRWRAVDDLSVWKRVLGGGLQFLRDFFALLQTLLRAKPDVIHLTTSGQFGVFRDLGIAMIAKLFGIPFVYHIRFGRIPQIALENSREWQLIAFVLRQSFVTIAIDRSTFEAIQKHLPSVRAELVPNCIHLAELPLVPSSESSVRTAFFVGWVIPAKGIAELIEAWALLKPQGWRLQIAGPGDRAYQQTLLEQHRPEAVEFIGELPHARAMEVMAACDLFVLPSHTEGFPNVILEAMALGKAIVATDVGAIPEMLSGGCGALVKPKDVPDLLAALRSLLEDQDRRLEMGKLARVRAVENYSIDAVFAKYMTIWNRAASRAETRIV
jgi:glycosyltransferase involved in cell wall biosynthesis